MIEKLKENFGERREEFDREAEKKYRQELRKILSTKISEALDKFGFEKTGSSLWSRKVGDLWQVVYLQRSQFSHQYYIEAGICQKQDIPKGEKPNIIFCKSRERIENIVSDAKEEQTGRKEDAKKSVTQKVNAVKAALDFEIPGVHEKYPEEYFVPSVGSEEAGKKIEVIQNAIEEYVPRWFQSKK